MKIGIVGSQLKDLNDSQQRTARVIIQGLLIKFILRDDVVLVSGGSDGIDTFADEEAQKLGFSTEIFEPSVRRWKGPGGFEERNKKIAEESDVVVAIRSMTSKTYGSGWTADYAESLGKEVHRIYV